MKKGISLIVLVITIIIMIILAAAVIISINNTGVIRQANTAVDSKEEKEIQHLISLAWSEAYIQGNRTVEELEAAMEEKLEGVDLSDYKYTVTEKGAFVDHVTTRADKEAKKTLNKYGFYYDYGYTVTMMSTIAQNTNDQMVEYAVVFRENGGMDVYKSGVQDSMGVLVCVKSYGAGSAVYSKNQIRMPNGQTATVVNGGAGININGIEMICNFAVSSGVQRNFNYFGVAVDSIDNSNGNPSMMPMFVTLADDDTMTVTLAINIDNNSQEPMRITGKVKEIVKDKIFDIEYITDPETGENIPVDGNISGTTSTTTPLTSLEHDIYMSYDGKQMLFLAISPERFPNVFEAQVDYVYTPPTNAGNN